MFLVLVASTSILVAYFVYLTVGVRRLSQGRGRAGSSRERIAMAALLALVAWRAIGWLYAGHPESSPARHILVWVQLLTAFGGAVLVMVSGWVAGTRRRD